MSREAFVVARAGPVCAGKLEPERETEGWDATSPRAVGRARELVAACMLRMMRIERLTTQSSKLLLRRAGTFSLTLRPWA